MGTHTPCAHQGRHDHDGHEHGHASNSSMFVLSAPEQRQWLGWSVVLFVAGWILELGFEAPLLAELCFWGATAAAAVTFVADIIEQPLSVATLMAVGAAGAVLLGAAHEAATLALLFAVSEFVVHRTFDRTQADLRRVLDLVPREVTVLRDGTERQVTAAEIVCGDHMVVRPGERLATDGVVRNGSSAVDLSAVTGEPLPVEVHPGASVYAAGVNGSGALVVEATTTSIESSLSRLVELLEAARNRRGTSEQLVDRLAAVLIFAAVAVSTGALAVGVVTGNLSDWAYRAVMVLVAMSPCALAIAVPVSMLAAIGTAGRHGVLVKGGAVLESLARCQVAALDKTGTLTTREPRVLEVVAVPGSDAAAVLATAGALEARTDHPLAEAILTAAGEVVVPADQVVVVPGCGVTGRVDTRPVRLGNPAFVSPGPLNADVERLQADGGTVVVVELDGSVIGLIAVRDELRPEGADAVQDLERAGIGHVALLTGDNRRAASALGGACGITDIRAELLPQDKVAAVEELSTRGPVLMVGDGLNDAPALAAAETGVAMGAMGSDLAVEAADAALLGTDLRQLGALVAFARRTRRIVRQQLSLSALVVAGLVPLAVTGTVNLAVAVLVHELSGTLVVLAGLRAGRPGTLAAGAREAPKAAPDTPAVRPARSFAPRLAAVALAALAVVVAAAGIVHQLTDRPNRYVPWAREAQPVVDAAFAIESDHLEVAAGEELQFELDCAAARPMVDSVAERFPPAPDRELDEMAEELFAALRRRYDACLAGDTPGADAALTRAQELRRMMASYTVRKTGGGHVH